MTPGARAAAAIDLLEAIEIDHSQPADRLVTGWFRRNRFAGSGDRNAISKLVYTVLRRRAQIDWWLDRVGMPASPRARVVAALMRGDGWSADRIGQAFDGGQYRPQALSQAESATVERLAGDGFGHDDQPLHVRGNIPKWLADPFRLALAERLELELAALQEEAPTDLRVNTLLAGRNEAIARLAADGVEAAPTPLSPIGLRLKRRVALAATSAFREGIVEPQDEASQIACLMLEAQPGESVVDFCAGAGGKTLVLAAAMENRGRLIACDISGPRLDRARPRLARAGATIVELRTLGGADGLWPGAEMGTFNRVLVDAPCSGTGTWRRAPESRWRLTESDIARHVAAQTEILDSSARLVAPGGRLVYAVCSLLAVEGEGVVLEFLRRQPDFAVLPASRVWRRAVGGRYGSGDAYLRLLPARDRTDGFFVSVLERVRKNKESHANMTSGGKRKELTTP